MNHASVAISAWNLISLRPQGQHTSLRQAAAGLGARTVAVSPWRLQGYTDELTRTRLVQALHCDWQLFTSPAAVKAAGKCVPLAHMQRSVAVGAGTARALRQQGVQQKIEVPVRMDSEGVLALPLMAHLQGKRVALITAPGGRGLIAEHIVLRGGEVWRVNVYERVALRLKTATLNRLQALTGPTVLAVSSAQALQQVLPQLPDSLRARWLQQPVVVASERLAQCAKTGGFSHIHLADGPLPAQLARCAYAALL